MTKKFFYVASMILCAMFVFNACSDSNDSKPAVTPDPQTGTGISQGTAVKPANMKMSGLSGFVYDAEGNVLSGVTVTSGDETFVTGSDGGFKLDKVNSKSGRTIVKFSCGGYVDVVRSYNTKDGDVWEVVMLSSYNPTKSAYKYFKATQSATIATPTGMKVDVQSDGLKFADQDRTISQYDDASVNVMYLSPDDETFAQSMPGGDLAAVRTDGSEAQLVSYGMTKVDMDIYGYKAQLADGKPATLTFPVPEKFKDNTPDEIPLWSFNEETGLWEEEGIATYDATNKVYVGTVTHFSWVNLDYPEKRATVKVVVKDQSGALLPNVKVDIDGQRTCFTDVNGVAECYVPTNTSFYVTIHSEDYSNYTPEVKEEVPAMPQAGAEKTVEIVLPTLAHISGKVVNSGKGNSLATLWIEYNGKETKRVHNDAQGQFFMNAPADYKGDAKLMMRSSDGKLEAYDIKLDGQDHAYTLTIKTDKATGGSFTFTAADGTKETRVIPPTYYEDNSGVEIVDNKLGVDAEGCYFYIDNYNESKTTYNNVYISGWSDGRSITCDSTATVKVAVNEFNNYTFTVSGSATLSYWENNQSVKKEGTISGSFTLPLLGKGTTIRNITKRESFFPSFTPWIDGKKANIGFCVTESEKFGTGVALWFFDKTLTYDDYKAYKDLAVKALGAPIETSDTEEGGQGQDIAYSYFVKDGKYIMVSFCPWRDVDEEYLEEEMKYMEMGFHALMENHAARIHVHALEGVKVDPQSLMFMHGRVKANKDADWRPEWIKRRMRP